MLEVSDPPHFGVGMPSSAAASCSPYWVGVKNGLVVTWLTNQNCHAGVLGKLPAALFVPALVLDDEVHAEISADAAAVALKSPVPLSSLRRVGPSFMLRVSIASSTTGSTLLIWTSMGFSRNTHCPEPDPLRRQRSPSKSSKWWHEGKARALSQSCPAYARRTAYR